MQAACAKPLKMRDTLQSVASPDFQAAARRHHDDAQFLLADSRWANAGHLAGLAAECALKAIMQLIPFGATPNAKGILVLAPNSKLLNQHVDKLWSELALTLNGPAAPAFMAYEYRCAFCEFDGALDNGTTPGLEAAHVRWWTHGGPNDIDNGLCLCSIHHKLFDKGVLGITDQHQVTVSQHFTGRSHAAKLLVHDLNGKQASRPMKGYPSVSANYAAWHAREVFRAPARAA